MLIEYFQELISLIPTIKRIGAKLIALTANEKSKLAIESDIAIITPVLKEACPLALAPTSSTTIALIAGDAIAMALMELKNFKEAIEDYNKAIFLDENDKECYYNRAIAKYNIGERESACKDLQKAFKLGDKQAEDVLNELCH